MSDASSDISDTFLDVYQDRRVLVTGHTGFKGSWLCLWLEQLGAKVSGIALDPHTSPNLFDSAGLATAVDDLRCDIRDYEGLVSVVADVEPDLVLHLAAQPIVRASYTQSLATFETNVMGSVNVFECACNTPSVSALVHVSTDKCYDNDGSDRAFSESDKLGGQDPYSASKGAAEIAFSSYAKSFFPETNILAASGRAGNVIGGGDWADDRIVPDCIRSLHKGNEIGVRNPSSTRPWQHVLEALSGYLMLGAQLLEGHRFAVGGWNFGPRQDSTRTVEELVGRIIETWGEGTWRDVSDIAAPHEAKTLRLDCSKAEEELSWWPRWDFDETVRRTVNWYRAILQGCNAKDACMMDIADYMACSRRANHVG